MLLPLQTHALHLRQLANINPTVAKYHAFRGSWPSVKPCTTQFQYLHERSYNPASVWASKLSIDPGPLIATARTGENTLMEVLNRVVGSLFPDILTCRQTGSCTGAADQLSHTSCSHPARAIRNKARYAAAMVEHPSFALWHVGAIWLERLSNWVNWLASWY